MMVGGDVHVASEVLVKFAQKLASNEKRSREIAVKKLKRWLEIRSRAKIGGFDKDDMLKIWKGLHYCMWMSDKMIVQEDLAESISLLIHCFKRTETSLLFLDGFLHTMGREWFEIDRLRLDKFMMLFRKCVHQAFILLKCHSWDDVYISKMCEMLSTSVMSGENHSVPDGLKYHMTDIFLEELTGAGAYMLEPEQVKLFLQPYCNLLGCCRNQALLRHVRQQVFEELYQEGVNVLREDNDTVNLQDRLREEQHLAVNHSDLAEQLMEIASKSDCISKNRPLIYMLVKRFQDLSKKIIPAEENVIDETADPLDHGVVKDAIERLTVFEEGIATSFSKNKRKKHSEVMEKASHLGLLRKKKQKQNGLVGEKVNKRKTKGTTINSNCNSSLENVSSSKPKRKKKKKSNKNDSFNNAGSVDCKNVDNIEYETKNVNNEMTTANTPKEQSAFCNIASSTEKSKKKRRSINRECDDLDLIKTKAASITEELKEIEIWVPNKKYKGKLKGLEEEKIARNEKNKISAANLQCMNSLKQSKQNEIVNFEKSPHIPAAFVKKALKKLSCHSEPRKTLTKVVKEIRAPDSEPGKKRVSFVMKNNKAQDYIEYATTLEDTSASPFDPCHVPAQGILKKHDQIITPKKKLFGAKRRSKAADFFNC